MDRRGDAQSTQCERSTRHATANAGSHRRRGRLALVALPLLVFLLVIAPVGCGPVRQSTPTQPGPPAGQTSGTAATPSPQLVYVALGASDAFGVGTDDPATQAWPVVLRHTLGDSYRLINLGIPGATVALATRAELPIALDVQPAIITVWLAVNDFDAGVTLDTYTSQLDALLQQLVTGTHARIYVGNLPDLALLPHFAHGDLSLLESEVLAWNAAIAADCAQAGVALVDLFDTWSELASHPEYISADGFHPSAAGAARLAALFAAAIAPASSPAASGAPGSASAGPTAPSGRGGAP
jgi:lysophospholipase L1-like esterase